MKEKLKLIYIPYLTIAICFIAAYTFIDWLLFIKLQILPLKEEIIHVWGPIVLLCIAVFIWLKPRIKLLSLKGGNGNLPYLYTFAAAFTIMLPTVNSVDYVRKASGRLTTMTSIDSIDKLEQTKYYALKKFYIDKMDAGVHTSVHVNGSHNENLDFVMCYSLPIYKSISDTVNKCIAFLGISYSKHISNRLSASEKDSSYRTFCRESPMKFNREIVDDFTYLERIDNTSYHDDLNRAAQYSSKFDQGSYIILTPVYSKFEERTGNEFGWIYKSFLIGAIIWLIMILIPSLDKAQLKKYKAGKQDKGIDFTFLSLLFVPKKGFGATPIIIEINLIIFLIMVFAGLGFISFQPGDLVNWGANYKPLTNNGELWRLVTCIFLHGGVLHLVFNMCALFYVGLFLEPRSGTIKFGAIYLITGIIASVTSLLWNHAMVSIGASGAIFGMYGVFLALLLTKIFPTDFSKAMLSSTLLFIGYNLLMGIFGNIDNAAHIGGLLSGFIIGLSIYPFLKKNKPQDLYYLSTSKK